MEPNYFKFNYHSIVDVITNSSTTIYTTSDGSIGPAKELITEFAKSLGVDVNVDDMFDFHVFCDEHHYTEYWDYDSHESPFKELDYAGRRKAVGMLLQQVGTRIIPKPKWMDEVEDNDEIGTTLYLFPKEEKYMKLGELMTKFLYSTESESDGN